MNRMSDNYITKEQVLSFVEELEKRTCGDDLITKSVLVTTKCVKDFVMHIPPEDVRPVVHCKDCRWCMVNTDCTPFCSNDKPPVYAITDYFGCIYGKRKGADNE